MKNSKQAAVKLPEWLKEENDEVFSIVASLMFGWAFYGEEAGKSLRQEMSETYDDSSEEDLDRAYSLLVEHGIVKVDERK